MTQAEDKQPLMRGAEPSSRGFLVPALATLGVYFVASITSRAIMWEYAESSTDTAVSGLINPNNGSYPRLTSTEDCTGDFSLPVLGGVDVVAYWTLPDGAEPVSGTAALTSLYGNYRFYFSSIENLRAFESDPERYVPAFGGFCSFGVAAEAVWTADTLGPFGDPSKWTISSDERLHVFRSRLPMMKFSVAPVEFIKAGRAIWDSWFPADQGPAPMNTACLCSEEICVDA